MSKRLKPSETPERPLLTPAQLATWPKLHFDPDTRHHTGTVEEMAACAAEQYIEKEGKPEGGFNWTWGTFEACVDMVIRGWSEGVEMVDGVFARLTAKNTETLLPRLDYSDEADGDVDVEAWAAGEDECYIVATQSPVRVSVAGQFVTVYYDPFASCDRKADEVLMRGIYVASLVYVMDRAGYRVKVQMRMPNTRWGAEHWLLDVTVKEYEQLLDLPRFVFWIAHPGVLRHFVILMYRAHRDDGIGPRRESNPPEGIHTPQFTSGLELDSWLTSTLDKAGLHFHDEGK